MESIGWRDFLRPVQASEMPEARTHIRQGLRSVTLAFLLSAIVIGLILPVAGVVRTAPHLASTALSVAALAGFYRASSTRFGRKHPEWLLLGVGYVAVAATLLLSWSAVDGASTLHEMALIVVLAVSAFTPWQMRYTLLLGLGTTALYALFAWLSPHEDTVTLPVALAFILILTALATASAQLQRRMWASLHRANAQALAASRLSSIGRISEGLAHEARTPLASTMNQIAAARLLLDELDASVGHPDVTPADLSAIVSEVRECLDDGDGGLERVATLIGSLRGHAFELRDRPTIAFPVNDALRAVASRFADLERPVVRLEAAAASVQARGDPDTLRRILHSLVENAVQAITETGIGTRVRVGVTVEDDALICWVDDDGPGIPEDLRDRIFDPMITTRSHRSAVGLGLPIARDVVQSVFGGQLTLARWQGGARFEIALPRGRRAMRAAFSDAHRPVLGPAADDSDGDRTPVTPRSDRT